MTLSRHAAALADLLALVACPVTGAPLSLEQGDAARGLLASGGMSAGGRALLYPIIGGVPRLLPPDLLHPFLRASYPDAYESWPALRALAEEAAGAPPPPPEVLETLTAYDFHHLDLNRDAPGGEGWLWDEWRESWDRFQPRLPPESMAGEVVLEVGCGEGRHARLVTRAGAARLVGLDLSRGVERARALESSPAHHFIQGDLRRPPLRRGAFDAVYSNGVLHHTPDPRASFAAVAPLARRGGRVSVWVYGLDEMRWSYRASHLTWLRPLTGSLPRPAKLAVAAALTAGVEAGLWLPARALQRAGLGALAARLPYHEAAGRDWDYKLRRMFDRLSPPVTHYIMRAELEAWFAGFDGVEMINTQGQGWCAFGRAP